MILQSLSSVWTALAPAVGNHLWQSTLFALAAGLLTLALRKNHARARYWLWLVASLKFLVPFSLLTALGSRMAWSRGSAATQGGALSFVIEQVSRPFAQQNSSQAAAQTIMASLPAILASAWACGFVAILVVWFVRWRLVSAGIRNAAPLREGREVKTLRRLEEAGGVRRKIEIFLSRASLEPGILGIVKPVLVWPQGISDRLEDGHLEAILAHEVWHVRRNDNLAAAVHMVVEAIFWFHPLVWWLGARMVDERERACDEEVLQLGSEPQVYAESILKICEFCVGSPLACVAGVTGSDLKKRIANIMNKNIVRKLNFGKKLLLSALGMAAIALPIIFGLAKPAHSQSQASSDMGSKTFAFTRGYQKVSVTPGHSEDGVIQTRIVFRPDSLTAKNQTLQELLKLAYGVQASQISGGPDWLATALFNVEAKLDDSTVAELKKLSPEQQKMERDLMFQNLLADQFKIALHRESRLLPAQVLVIAKNGPKIQPAKPGDTYPNGIKGPDGLPAGPHKFNFGPEGVIAQALPMSFVANNLATHLGQPVVDRTGLTGDYDFTLKFSPASGTSVHNNEHTGAKETTMPVTSISERNAALVAAIEEQLGLKLEPQTIPLPVLVIDRAEKPAAN